MPHPAPDACGPTSPTSPTSPTAPPTGRISRAMLRKAARSGTFTPAAWEEASRFLGFRPDARAWGEFWKHILTLYGTLFLVSGIIFFIAWNWVDMHRFMRIGLMQFLVAVPFAYAALKGVDSRSGYLCLLAGGVLIGPLLAVHGQTYQTGAELWELFRLWAAFLLVPAAVGRRTALWFLCWLTACTSALLYLSGIQMEMSHSLYALQNPLFLFCQVLVWALWEGAARLRGGRHPWLRERWFPRTMAATGLLGLSLLIMDIIRTSHLRMEYFGSAALLPGILLYLVLLPTVLFFYRKKTPDLFILSCAVFSLCACLIALLFNMELFFEAGIGTAALLWSGVFIGISTAAGKILLSWQRRMEQDRLSTEPAPGGLHERAGTAHPDDSPEALHRHLHRLGLWAEDPPPFALQPAGTPWFILLFQGFAGWLASVLLFVFIVFALDISNDSDLLVSGLVALAAAAFFSRVPNQAAKQFGLAAGLAGCGAAATGIGLLVAPNPIWPLAASAVVWLGFLLVRSGPFRFLAVIAAVALLLAYQWFTGAGTTAALLFWLLCCTGLAVGYLRENVWVGNRTAAGVIPPLLYGFLAAAAVFLYLCVLPPTAEFPGYGQQSASFFPSARMLGAASGGALLLIALVLSQRLAATPGIRLFFLGAAAGAVLLGWHLPGAALGFLGLTLARQSGDKVLAGACGLFTAAYIFQYYYTLHASLLHKSLTLIAVGAALLALGLGLERLLGPSKAEAENNVEAGHA